MSNSIFGAFNKAKEKTKDFVNNASSSISTKLKMNLSASPPSSPKLSSVRSNTNVSKSKNKSENIEQAINSLPQKVYSISSSASSDLASIKYVEPCDTNLISTNSSSFPNPIICDDKLVNCTAQCTDSNQFSSKIFDTLSISQEILLSHDSSDLNLSFLNNKLLSLISQTEKLEDEKAALKEINFSNPILSKIHDVSSLDENVSVTNDKAECNGVQSEIIDNFTVSYNHEVSQFSNDKIDKQILSNHNNIVADSNCSSFPIDTSDSGPEVDPSKHVENVLFFETNKDFILPHNEIHSVLHARDEIASENKVLFKENSNESNLNSEKEKDLIVDSSKVSSSNLGNTGMEKGCDSSNNSCISESGNFKGLNNDKVSSNLNLDKVCNGSNENICTPKNIDPNFYCIFCNVESHGSHFVENFLTVGNFGRSYLMNRDAKTVLGNFICPINVMIKVSVCIETA